MSYKLVYQQIIAPEAWKKLKNSKGWLDLETSCALVDAGINTVKRLAPNSKYRTGCNCCFGDGPDIHAPWPEEQLDGSGLLNVYADFDFRVLGCSCDG